MRNERTSIRVSSIAARVLRRGSATRAESLILAASCLTQAPDRQRMPRAKKARKAK